MLVKAEGSQQLLDLLEATFADEDGFRINIFALEASFPSIPERNEIEDLSSSDNSDNTWRPYNPQTVKRSRSAAS